MLLAGGGKTGQSSRIARRSSNKSERDASAHIAGKHPHSAIVGHLSELAQQNGTSIVPIEVGVKSGIPLSAKRP
jgi:hypothetical protein